MDEMGAIFNKVASAGKISAEEINQLNERGIPITKLLADTMGVSTEKVKDLVSAGKVGFPEFQTAIEKGMGGAAQAMGGTFEGSIKNVKAALSRMGEGILTPFIKNMTPELGDITSAIDDIAKKLAPTFEEIAKKIDWKSLAQSIVNAVTGIINFIGYISEHKDVISALATALGIVVAGVWALTAAQTALNLAMSLNPIGLMLLL
jgi:tape measure domain-containing protein